MLNDIDEEFIPYKSERKLANLFRTDPLLNQNKELQDKITSLIKGTLKEARAEWCDMRATTLDSVIKVHQRTNASKGGIERDKKYAQFRKKFAKIQKEYFIRAYQNNQKLTANIFVEWFMANKAEEIKIPYVKQNQKNKLRQLAQANNRKFKKLLFAKSAYFSEL